MLCPHCKKRIFKTVRGALAEKASELKGKGFSLRRIQYLLSEDGFRVSTATLGRFFQHSSAG